MSAEFKAALLSELDGITGTVRVVGAQILFDAGDTVYLLHTKQTEHRGNRVPPEQIPEWVRLRKTGLPYSEIARQVGYADMTVYRAIRRAMAEEEEVG